MKIIVKWVCLNRFDYMLISASLILQLITGTGWQFAAIWVGSAALSQWIIDPNLPALKDWWLNLRGKSRHE